MNGVIQKLRVLDIEFAENLFQFGSINDFAGQLASKRNGQHIRKVLAVQNLFFQHQAGKGLLLYKLLSIFPQFLFNFFNSHCVSNLEIKG